MADKKISQLTASTTPLAGTEVLPIVQGTPATTVKVAVSDLTAGRSISTTGVNITGTASKITGDFSNATFANRTAFQDATTNNNTFLSIIPNGTGTISGILCTNNSDLTNTSTLTMSAQATQIAIGSSILGSGTYLPIRLQTSGSTKFEVTTAGDCKVSTGNLVIGTSGKGIDFSATAGTGTSELLADYEEGTWTPQIRIDASGGNAGTWFSALTNCAYQKVGNFVHVFGAFSVSGALDGSNGYLRMKSLPYAPVNPTIGSGVFTLRNTVSSNNVVYSPYLSEAEIYLFLSTTGAGLGGGAEIDGSTSCNFHFMYQTA